METSQQSLVLHHLPLVRLVASQIKAHLPPYYLFEDLEQYGVLGLIDAVERYDSSRGVPFNVYAKRRIYGAIVDNIRRQEWLPRSVMQRIKRIEKVRTELRNKLQCEPSEQEVACQLGITVQELATIEQQAAGLLSLDDDIGRGEEGESYSLADVIGSGIDVEEQVDWRESVRRLGEALGQLSERERMLVTLYYYEDLTLREIGEILGVSESRVCQLHKRALKQLKVLLS